LFLELYKKRYDMGILSPMVNSIKQLQLQTISSILATFFFANATLLEFFVLTLLFQGFVTSKSIGSARIVNFGMLSISKLKSKYPTLLP